MNKPIDHADSIVMQRRSVTLLRYNTKRANKSQKLKRFLILASAF